MNPSERPLPDLCRETMAQYNMISRGDSLVVGVSGGADSVALLCFLHSVAGELDLTLSAAHLNHNLRGQESHRDEAHVRALCDRMGIPLTVESLPIAAIAADRGQSVEECARDQRYDLFHRAAGEKGKIATAHTLDDSAETMLLNLARGTGIRGLCGIPPVRGRIIRPLIRCARAQVEAYCAEMSLDYVTDSTNLSDDYTRNKLRHQVLPVLREINPALLRGMAHTAEALRADADYLDGLAGRALAEAKAGDHCWNATTLRGLPQPLRRRALLRLCGHHGVQPHRDKILRLEDLLAKGGKIQLSGGWYCENLEDRLCFVTTVPPAAGTFPPFVLTNWSQRMEYPVFSDKMLVVSPLESDICEKTKNIRQNQFKNALDCDKMGGIVKCRPRLPSDSIRLAGRGCTKSLRKLYQEAGLSNTQRQRRLVIADEAGPVWVEGFGVAERACPGPGSRRILHIKVLETG